MVNQEGGVQAIYQAALDQGRFEIQRCNDCGDAIFFHVNFAPVVAVATCPGSAPAARGRSMR